MEGRRVGSYRIVRLVGNGGMASVFEGVSEPGGERVAVKILHPSYAGNADIAARFLNEARTSHFIGHPGFVRIFDSGRLPDGVA